LADALGSENVYGISMPSKLTSDESKSDAKKLAENLKINFLTVEIKDSVELLKEKYNNIFSNIEKNWPNRYKDSFTIDNIQARSRSMILWAIANEFGQTLPVATSDKSELYMGYATINGDMSGGYAPIADVVKTKLFALARWMNKNREQKNAIPESIILKPPTAELAVDNKTGKTLLAEDALMPYEFLDEVIWRIENLNQSSDDMLKEEFLYEKKNKVDIETKKLWLNKFFRRLNTALYKWYIVAPSPVIDARSINKIEFKQPIVSNIDYLK
jgi:NAD+ synthetase